MNTYRGLHARHYDLVYGEKPYSTEARFVDALLREADAEPGRLLDVACGTGRHAAQFSALGWDVTGVDHSESLLEHARRNAPDASFLCQDMRKLDVPGAPFDAVTCLFDSIGYPLEDAGIVAALSGMRRHAAPGSPVAIEFLHAPALLRRASPLGVRTWPLSENGAGELVRISRVDVDESARTMQVEYELLELHGDGTYERWRETQANRFFTTEEMGELLEAAGLRAERFLHAYTEGAEIDDETFHVLVVARLVG